MTTKLIQNGTVFLANRFVKADLLIENGKIKAIGQNLPAADEVIDAKDKLVAPGLIDVHVHFREPGQSYKETIKAGSLAAAHGGYTTVGAMPNVDPVPDTVERMQNQVALNQADSVVNIFQYGAITHGRTSEELVDFAALKDAGAYAFSNDGSGVQTAGTMYQAMEKIAHENMILAAHVEDDSLLFGGVMTAGKRAEELGLPGAPSVSESSQVARDLVLANATGVHYHICHVSTKESVAMVRFAKQQGVKVTCEVSPHHLLLADQDIPANNSYYKMNPPLRHEDDRQAMIEGLLDGTIDMIATDHAPHSVAEKPKDDMRGAANGITGLETAFPMLYTKFVKTGVFTLAQLLNWMSTNPADVFGLTDVGRIEIGQPADLAIFDLDTLTTIKEQDYLSKGINNPFTGEAVYGSTVMTLVDGEVVYGK